MTEAAMLTQERNKLFEDVLNGRIPKRVPITLMIEYMFAIQYAGKDLMENQWSSTALEEICEKTCRDFTCDIYPIVNNRFTSVYRILGAKNFVMGATGVLQHPEIEGMDVEDYDPLIASPYDCIIEKILPKLYSEYNQVTYAKAFKAFFDEMTVNKMVSAKLTQKLGYSTIPFNGSACEAPFDFLSDQLRGFKGISMDIRRIPEKVGEAVNAITPLMIKLGSMQAPGISKNAPCFIPLHLAPYLRTKDFEKYYWPSFKQLIEGLRKNGITALIFAEQDWMRYLDYLQDLPENTRIWFEYGDPKLAKEKVGNKHIISGFYPLTLLKTGTKQQCIDKAKELIDILAPGGRYIFNTDKSPVTLDSVNVVENLQAVLNYVMNNANY